MGAKRLSPVAFNAGVGRPRRHDPSSPLDVIVNRAVKKIIKCSLLMIGWLFAIPDVAFANAGVPMLFVMIPAFGLSIIPIIVIEALYLSKKLGLPWKAAGRTSTISNIVSTVVGIPLTWVFLAAVQVVTGGDAAYGIDTAFGKVISVTWQAPWLIPYESELHWMIPAAGFVLFIPFFFVSWWFEYLVSRRMHRGIDKRVVRRYVKNANVITYGLLTLWPLVMLAMHGI